MFTGLTNVNYIADDVAGAAQWYARVLGVEPYFVRPETGPPGYVEFRVGDAQDELAIMDRRYAGPLRSGDRGAGVLVYWHVEDVAAVLRALVEAGATEYEPVVDRGSGFSTASVVDPFGNLLGLMHSPHYLEVSASSPTPATAARRAAAR